MCVRYSIRITLKVHQAIRMRSHQQCPLEIYYYYFHHYYYNNDDYYYYVHGVVYESAYVITYCGGGGATHAYDYSAHGSRDVQRGGHV